MNHSVAVRKIETEEFANNRIQLGDRIAAAEIEVESVLRRHGVKFAINVVSVAGKSVHQEIVLVDRRD